MNIKAMTILFPGIFLSHMLTSTRILPALWPCDDGEHTAFKQSPQSPLIFRSYGPKSTHNTQLTEGVIPGNIRINPGYIRYMQTNGQSQGHYGGKEEEEEVG